MTKGKLDPQNFPIIRETAIILTNYNMPERTDALIKKIKLHTKSAYHLFVVDNGSDRVMPSYYTTVQLKENCQTVGGWLAGLKAADNWALLHRRRFFAFCFMITSAEFVDCNDNLTPCIEILLNDPNAVGAHPALTPDSTTHWEHMKARGGKQPRQTWMIDNIMSVYRADWFDSIGRFDPALVYGWGSDLETCFHARAQSRSLWIAEAARIKKVTNIGYMMQRMNMSAACREQFASENMQTILSRKHGSNWRGKMYGEGVPKELM